MKILYCLLFLTQYAFSADIRGSFAGNLASLEAVSKGEVTQKKVSDLFGKPDKSIDTKNLPGTFQSGMIWEFNDAKGLRLTVNFDQDKETVLGWTWTVLDPDPERDLKTALDLFREQLGRLNRINGLILTT